MVVSDPPPRPDHEESASPPSRLQLTAKGRRTRARVLDSARRILEKKGYFEASVADIVGDSNLALGTFYRYFANKEQAFMVLLEWVVKELYDSTGGSWRDDDPLGSLTEASRRYLTAYEANRRLIAALLQMAAASPQGAAVWADLRERTHRSMAGNVAARVSGADAELSVSALATMVEYSAYRWFVDAPRADVPTVDAAAETLGRIWYRALYDTKRE